jgi:hypothetical protein
MIKLPTYTLKNTKTNKKWDVFCSYDSLQEMLKDPDVEKVLSTAKFVSGVDGGQGKRVPSGFNDLKREIRKSSGRGNTIKVD